MRTQRWRGTWRARTPLVAESALEESDPIKSTSRAGLLMLEAVVLAALVRLRFKVEVVNGGASAAGALRYGVGRLSGATSALSFHSVLGKVVWMGGHWCDIPE